MYEWLEPVYRPKMDRIAAESMALGEARGIALGAQRGMLDSLRSIMEHKPLTMDEIYACFPTLSDDDIRSALE